MYSNTFQKYLYSFSNTLVNDIFIFMNLESIRICIRILFKVFAPGLTATMINGKETKPWRTKHRKTKPQKNMTTRTQPWS